MDLQTHIVVTAQDSFTTVYPYPHTNHTFRGPRVFGQGTLDPRSGFCCVTRANKNEKEAVSPLSHFDPPRFAYYLSKKTGMGFKHFPVPGTKTLYQSSGALYVCEDKGHGTCG
jgi:hypothetical protein